MLRTFNNFSTSMQDIKIPSIENKQILFFLIFVIFLKFFNIPINFPYPLNFLNILGMGRLAFVIALFYAYHSMRFNPSIHPYPYVGLKTLICIFFGAILSFSLYALDFSFAEQLRLNSIDNSLRIYGFIRAPGFMLMFILIFSYYKRFEFLIKIFLYGASVVMLLVIFNIDEAVISIFGTVKELGQVEKLGTGFEYLRRSFVTMDNNVYGGLLSGLVLISLYFLFAHRKKKYKLFCLFFLILSTYSVFVTVGRANSVKLTISILIFVLLSTKVILKQFRATLLLFSASLIVFIQLISQSLAFRILIMRWNEIIFNLKNYGMMSGLSIGVYHDNYGARILAAVASMPPTLYGWIFGTGGIQTGYASLSPSASHMELANWLSQYGLITFIPFIGYQLILFNYLRRYQMDLHSNPKFEIKLYLLRNLGLALFIGLWLEMLVSPLFFARWVWLGILTSIVMILKREKMRSSKLKQPIQSLS